MLVKKKHAGDGEHIGAAHETDGDVVEPGEPPRVEIVDPLLILELGTEQQGVAPDDTQLRVGVEGVGQIPDRSGEHEVVGVGWHRVGRVDHADGHIARRAGAAVLDVDDRDPDRSKPE